MWSFLVHHLLMSLSKAIGLISKQCIFKDRTKKPEQGKSKVKAGETLGGNKRQAG